ncbi:MAG: metallophosphoesterase [Pseudomonadales bacterium]
MLVGRRDMADFRVIRYRGRRLRPIDTVEIHQQEREWLAKQMAEPSDGPTVVVTHHLPHEKSVAEQHVDSDLNPAFGSDLGEMIRAGQPAIWIHGHTHSPCDYQVRETRVLCDPLEYSDESSTDFDPALVVNV